MLIAMELSRIVISEIDEQHIIFLKESDGDREFPILIGLFEASSIDRQVKGDEPKRPLTHRLLRQLIEDLGGEPIRIVINRLDSHIYFADVEIEQNGKTIKLDSRPSDAVALAVQYNPFLPIFVEEEVLDQSSQRLP